MLVRVSSRFLMRSLRVLEIMEHVSCALIEIGLERSIIKCNCVDKLLSVIVRSSILSNVQKRDVASSYLL